MNGKEAIQITSKSLSKEKQTHLRRNREWLDERRAVKQKELLSGNHRTPINTHAPEHDIS